MVKPLTAGEKIARDLCEMDAPIGNIIEVDHVDVARRIDEEVFSILDSLADCAFRNERLVANYAEVQEENNTLRRIHAENLAIKDAEIAQLQDSSIDKLMELTDEQVTALTRLEGSNPDDAERIAKQAMKLAMLNVELTTLQSKSAALVNALKEVDYYFDGKGESTPTFVLKALAAFKGET